jgi:DNA-binding NtrC family response regulator
LLAEHFLGALNARAKVSKQFTRAARVRLRQHGWPGNLRELKNVVERAYILAEEGLGVDALPQDVTEEAVLASLVTMPAGTPMPAAERMLILATLEQFQGDKRKTASALQISLNTLYTRLKEYKAN